jgi:hypothetical protein
MPETKAYVGSKLIRAYPEKHAEGHDGYRVIYPDGYESWSPKATFELAYREITQAEKDLVR